MKEGGCRQAGFTIVETMVVLAVTGALFVSAVILINGRQNRTQFMTAVNGLQQQLQQIIGEASNGFYPDTTQFSCSRGASTPPGLTPVASGDRQGQNPDCIFLGKVVQFGVAGTDPEQYQVYPIIGNRMNVANSAEASTLYGSSGTFPEAAAGGTSLQTHQDLVGKGADRSVFLANGLQTDSMWYGSDTNDTTGAVGFISTLPSLDGNGVASGAQTLRLYVVQNTSLQQPTQAMVDAIYPGVITSEPLLEVSAVHICVTSGTTNQSGLITIGANDNASAVGGLTVTLAIKTGTKC